MASDFIRDLHFRRVVIGDDLRTLTALSANKDLQPFARAKARRPMAVAGVAFLRKDVWHC
jgi:hypothetical protein